MFGSYSEIIVNTCVNVICVLQEKPYQGKQSHNQSVQHTSHYHKLVDNSPVPDLHPSPLNGTSWDRSRLSNGSTAAATTTNGSNAAAWESRSTSASQQRLSGASLRHSSHSNRNSGSAVYYPGQRHPDMLPGDEAL